MSNKISSLNPDQLKVIYRGNYTLRQAAIYFGKSVEWVKAQIADGMLGTNLEGSHISRYECDRFLREDTRYKIPIIKKAAL